MPSLSKEQIDELFFQDSDGRYVNLVIPYINDDYPEIILTGKRDDELMLEEIVRLKKYAGVLYENMKDQSFTKVIFINALTLLAQLNTHGSSSMFN